MVAAGDIVMGQWEEIVVVIVNCDVDIGVRSKQK